MIPQNSFLEKQLTDFFSLSSQKINDVGFLFPVTLGYLCMKMDFFQIKVGTSLSDGKGICRAMCTLHIHASLNFLITFEMYNVFKWKHAIWWLVHWWNEGVCPDWRLGSSFLSVSGLFHLNIMSSRYIHIVANGRAPFFPVAE